MKFASVLAGLLILGLGDLGAAGRSVLFIGNSFLFGFGSAVRFYRADTVTDLNNEGIGGVPTLFKSFTQQAPIPTTASTLASSICGPTTRITPARTAITCRRW